MIIYLLLSVTVLLLTYWLWKINTGSFAYWKKCGLPQPPECWPFIGHVGELLLQRTYAGVMYQRFYDMYKGHSMVALNDVGQPAILLRDPELVKTVLQSNFANFNANFTTLNPSLDRLLKLNPFFSTGETWFNGRKNLTYAFTSNKLKFLAETVNEVCTKMLGFLRDKTAATGSVEWESKDLFSRFTGEVVANIGFGVEGFCFTEDPKVTSFKKLGDKLFDVTKASSVSQLMIFFFPKLTSLLRIRFVPKDMDEFFNRLVKQILEERQSQTLRKNDFLQLIVDREQSDGDKIDALTTTSHAFAFFVDGYETSSLTLTYVAYRLAAHPDVQEKVRREVLSLLPKSTDTITYEAIKEMTYLDQVIQESMRLHSVVPVMLKKCTQEMELKGFDGLSCRVDPGTEIIIPSLALQTDSKYWDNAETFDPERFSPDRKSELPKNCYFPFGEGPRICVGMRMAQLQMKAALAMLLKHYSLELSSRTQLPLKIYPKGFLAYPVGGIWVHIKRL